MKFSGQQELSLAVEAVTGAKARPLIKFILAGGNAANFAASAGRLIVAEYDQVRQFA